MCKSPQSLFICPFCSKPYVPSSLSKSPIAEAWRLLGSDGRVSHRYLWQEWKDHKCQLNLYHAGTYLAWCPAFVQPKQRSNSRCRFEREIFYLHEVQNFNQTWLLSYSTLWFALLVYLWGLLLPCHSRAISVIIAWKPLWWDLLEF